MSKSLPAIMIHGQPATWRLEILCLLMPYDVCEYDGIILSGSHYNCRKRDVYFPWYQYLMDLVRIIAANGKPNLFWRVKM